MTKLRREEGVTLVEMLVSMTISGIVLSALLMVVLTGFRSFQAGSDAIGESESVALVRISVSDDARSAYPDPSLTFAAEGSPDATCVASGANAKPSTLTLGVYDQANGFHTVVYRYVPATGEVTRAIAQGTSPLGAARSIGTKLMKCYVSGGSNPPVFTISGSVLSANLPLPGAQPLIETVKVVMRPQTP